MGEKLTELKNIIIKYCPAKANENLLNAALFDIYACEAGLESHCKVEDYIFVPAILKLEKGGLGKMKNNEAIRIAIAETSVIIRGGLTAALKRLLM